MLATCIYQRDVVGVPISEFHTFDNGKKRGLDGDRAVPILSYQDWCGGMDTTQKQLASQIINLKRRAPVHPSPKFDLVEPAAPIAAPQPETEGSGEAGIKKAIDAKPEPPKDSPGTEGG